MARIKPTRGKGRPAFEPTKEQREEVARMVGVRLTWDEICLLVINPGTKKPISKETLQKAFADELAVGKAELKNFIATRFRDKVEAGDWPAIQFGLRHINGWKDSDLNVSVSSGADGLPMQGNVTVEFVVPGHKPNGYDGNGHDG